ncbi:uncharacterized protein LOC113791724 isoform X2 [Dermatophagoides pteronyssinus]|uniref:uncharacterized protein LOC113791724 isoform X2 n=1 Tax=Dermatophagoides pteronyssinus TaxID=6956 RepID=UPI003F67B136
MNRLILTSTFTMIVFELIMAMGDNKYQLGGPIFVEGSMNDVNQRWKCADVISNPNAVRGELAIRKMKGDQKIRRFIENCIKWGDGWRFKKDGSNSYTHFDSNSILDQDDDVIGSDIPMMINDSQETSISTTKIKQPSSADRILLLRLYKNLLKPNFNDRLALTVDKIDNKNNR